MTTYNDELNAILKDAGVSKTVYAYTLPDGQRILDTLFDNRAAYHDMFTEAWTQKQDAIHQDFFNTWANWVKPIVELDIDQFPHVYPIAGAGEGLRATIQGYGCLARYNGFEPTIHVFEGEYEGYGDKGFAAAAYIPVKIHARENWREAIKQIGPRDQFYISQPSAIDGNVWEEFEEFAAALAQAQPTAELMLDLTYVGAVARDFKVKADHPNISKIFFSLSKPFGVYYHRIVGCLARQPDASLFGNKWFKNPQALKYGTALMNAFDVHALPRKYAPIQAQAANEAGQKLGLDLKLCDVFLLASAQPSAQPTDLERYLLRPNGTDPNVRVCLTPTMAHIVDPKLSNTVISRAHETLPGAKL